MRFIHHGFIELLFLMGATVSAAPVATVPLVHHPATFDDAYRLLNERNIFDRNRRAYHPEHADREPASVQNPFTLTGLVKEHGTYSAFIENSRTHTTTKYDLNDHVSGGKITAVGLDHIDLTTHGQTRRIELGQTLSGTAPTTESAGPTTGPSGNMQDILERLRQRRLQELHQ